MKELKDLLKVKSLVTISITITFVILALRNDIPQEEVAKNFGLLVAFFFGTQFEKRNANTKN